MYNTLNFPMDWQAKEFYKHPAPSSAEWNVVSILALGSVIFKPFDTTKSEKYLNTAKRAWEYMINQPEGKYKHPDSPLPRGMDPEYFYSICYKGSSADLGFLIVASKYMYDATKDNKYLNYIEKGANELCLCVRKINDSTLIIVRDKDSSQSVEGTGSYGNGQNTYLGVLIAVETMPQNENSNKWKETLYGLCESLYNYSEKSCYGKLSRIYTENTLDEQVGHPAPGVPTKILRTNITGVLNECGMIKSQPKDVKCFYNITNNLVVPGVDLLLGVFLNRCGKLFKESKYCIVAQKIIDSLIGGNIADISHIEAVGYNQKVNPRFGQFFPSTPQIPGAVNVGVNISSDYSDHFNYSEYDMPCVGAAMLLLSEI